MRASTNELRTYLAPGETLVDGTAGTLFDDSYRSEGSVGVTDRRVLFVSEDGGFQDVAHDAIYSVRSRPRRGLTYRGTAPALLAVLGGAIAAAAAVGVLVLAPRPLAFVLLLASVGGVAGAERVRRRGVGDVWRPLERAKSELVAALDDVEPFRGPTAKWSELGDDDLLILGVVSVALTASIGLVVVAGSLLVVPLALVALGGLALAEYGYRRRAERDPVGGERRERDVSLHLVDGRTVHLRLPPGGRFDRHLSAAVRESAAPTVSSEPIQR